MEMQVLPEASLFQIVVTDFHFSFQYTPYSRVIMGFWKVIFIIKGSPELYSPSQPL